MKTIIYSILFVVCYLPITINAQQITREQLIITWVFNLDTKTIEIKNPAGLVFFQKVKDVTSRLLVLKPKGVGKGILLLPEIHFTKL